MVRWARRGDENSYGDSGAPNIDEMEEKRVSGLDKEELGINLTLVLGQIRMVLQRMKVRTLNWEKLRPGVRATDYKRHM